MHDAQRGGKCFSHLEVHRNCLPTIRAIGRMQRFFSKKGIVHSHRIKLLRRSYKVDLSQKSWCGCKAFHSRNGKASHLNGRRNRLRRVGCLPKSRLGRPAQRITMSEDTVGSSPPRSRTLVYFTLTCRRHCGDSGRATRFRLGPAYLVNYGSAAVLPGLPN